MREICEVHGGRISLLNRQECGLMVTLVLPLPEANSVPAVSDPTAA